MTTRGFRKRRLRLTACTLIGCWAAAAWPTDAPMLRATREGGFAVTPIFSVGASIGHYQPVGILDGTAAFRRTDGRIRLLVTHELDSDHGYPWRLRNGVALTGARISFFDLDREQRTIVRAGNAITRAVDREGREVVNASQVNERGAAVGDRGFEAFCSASGFARGELDIRVIRVFLYSELHLFLKKLILVNVENFIIKK